MQRLGPARDRQRDHSDGVEQCSYKRGGPTRTVWRWCEEQHAVLRIKNGEQNAEDAKGGVVRLQLRGPPLQQEKDRAGYPPPFFAFEKSVLITTSKGTIPSRRPIGRIN